MLVYKASADGYSEFSANSTEAKTNCSNCTSVCSNSASVAHFFERIVFFTLSITPPGGELIEEVLQ